MKKTKGLLISTFLVSFTLPLVSARNTQLPALDSAIEMISGVFFPSVLYNNPDVQTGFFKFMFFLIIFATANWVLQKVFNKSGSDATGKRAANVISFAFSAIAAFFMPFDVAQASGGFITAIFSAIIPIGVTFGAVYLAFMKLKGNNGWWEHLLGMMILLFAIIILTWVAAIVG